MFIRLEGGRESFSFIEVNFRWSGKKFGFGVGVRGFSLIVGFLVFFIAGEMGEVGLFFIGVGIFFGFSRGDWVLRGLVIFRSYMGFSFFIWLGSVWGWWVFSKGYFDCWFFFIGFITLFGFGTV